MVTKSSRGPWWKGNAWDGSIHGSDPQEDASSIDYDDNVIDVLALQEVSAEDVVGDL
jgi:hypothetical protein